MTLVKRYSHPDLVLGRGPIQSIIILLKGSSKAGMGYFEGRIWDRIVSVADHCLSFYFASELWKGLVRLFYHLACVAGLAVLRNIRY